MKYIDKEQVHEVLGKVDFMKPLPGLFPAKYLGGITEMDQYIDRIQPIFEAHEKGLLIKLAVSFQNYRFAILNDGFEFITIEPQQVLMERKEKSVIGRALLGGVLLGPVGALVGGMSGLGSKDVKAKLPENILLIKPTDFESVLSFSVTNNSLPQLKKFFQKSYPQAWKEPAELESFLHPKEPQPGATISVADELRKLKTLLDDGILTAAEFEEQKKKLLK